MKAIIYQKYGGTEVLEYAELPQPQPGRGEVLIQVKAISLNPRDNTIRQGKFKFLSGNKFPKLTGADFSGTVVGLGENIKQIEIGSDVFGYFESLTKGVSAEYICIPEEYLAIKPAGLSHEAAACLGCAYLTALQALRDKGKLNQNKKILIYGASGGVGSAAIQLGKYYGAQVTVVSNSKNEAFCRGLGASDFIAYDKQDVFAIAKKFDVFFQVYSETGSLYDKAKNTIDPEGSFICLIPNPIYMLRKWFSKPRFDYLLVKNKRADLNFLADLALRKQINPAVTKTLELKEMAKGLEQLESRHAVGKIVIRIP